MSHFFSEDLGSNLDYYNKRNGVEIVWGDVGNFVNLLFKRHFMPSEFPSPYDCFLNTHATDSTLRGCRANSAATKALCQCAPVILFNATNSNRALSM